MKQKGGRHETACDIVGVGIVVTASQRSPTAVRCTLVHAAGFCVALR